MGLEAIAQERQESRNHQERGLETTQRSEDRGGEDSDIACTNSPKAL